jgi:hypothetical protein
VATTEAHSIGVLRQRSIALVALVEKEIIPFTQKQREAFLLLVTVALLDAISAT